MDDPVFHRFRHLLYTTRVPFNENLTISTKGWEKKKSVINYGVQLLDEFRSVPDTKEFHYEHDDGDRIRYIPGRLNWKENVQYMSVAILPADTDIEFNPDKPWKDLVEWPLKKYDPEGYDFKLLSLNYQQLAAFCDNNIPLMKKIKNNIELVRIEYAQEWLRLNYLPSKPVLKEIIDVEFVRFVTCFDKKELNDWMNDPSQCLHWNGTYDYKTHTAMFKRSTKLSGKNIRRCVTVKELLYQLLIDNLGSYESLYLDFDKCIHRSKCCNPHHFIVGRRQSMNNTTKRRRLIDDSIEEAFDASQSGSALL